MKIKPFSLDPKTCLHPEDKRMLILSGPGSWTCTLCGTSYETLPEPRFSYQDYNKKETK